MKHQPFNFELSNCLREFGRAFNDVIIKRFNEYREAEKSVPVKMLYAPKMRVVYDLTNPQKNVVLPIVSYSLTNYAIDNSRIQAKQSSFNIGDTEVRSPVPVDLTISLSIHTRYQMDMDQILSNFISACNPYIVVSWTIPTSTQSSKPQEIRSQVIWSGSFTLNYNLDKTPEDKHLISADTTYTFKTWIFPKHVDAAPIYKINIGMADRDIDYPVETLALSGNPTTGEITENITVI